MATAAVQNPNDWPGRYSHIDQILDRPGPRTIEEAFTGGEEVCVQSTGPSTTADEYLSSIGDHHEP
jgi:hypothetical protein